MKWKKIKHIFNTNENFSWMHSHASYPWAEQLDNENYRIFFSCRDEKNISSIAFIDFNMENLSVTHICNAPILSVGEIGTFDDCGVTMSCMLNVDNKKYLYYLGWNIMLTAPWRNLIGLATSENGINEFERISKAPILGLHDKDPFTLTYPFVMFDEGIYKMWYGSSEYWGPKVTDTNHVIKYATSNDGIEWQRSNIICINTIGNGEFAIVKPFVLKEDNIYKMWYAYRNLSYNLGYAESYDGQNWIRKDENIGIEVSKSGWDSEMICYPFIFDYNGNRYMLYNGNGYGKTGFGIAVLEK